jgi:hypothetical protein
LLPRRAFVNNHHAGLLFYVSADSAYLAFNAGTEFRGIHRAHEGGIRIVELLHHSLDCAIRRLIGVHFVVAEVIALNNGWTGAEIEAICREAGLQAIKRHYRSGDKESTFSVTKNDFDVAFATVMSNSGRTPLEHKKEMKK